MEISNLIPQFDYGNECKDIYSLTRWIFFKDIEIKIIKSNGLDLTPYDNELSSWLNTDAQEGIDIDTVVGTLPNPMPTARGMILDVNHSPIKAFTKQGVTASIEELLCGTVYSNYAFRHTTLSGEVAIMHNMCICSDNNTGGKFWVASEEQDIAASRGTIAMVELNEENYEGIEYEG